MTHYTPPCQWDPAPLLDQNELRQTRFALLNSFHWLPDGSGNTTNPAAKSAYDKLSALAPAPDLAPLPDGAADTAYNRGYNDGEQAILQLTREPGLREAAQAVVKAANNVDPFGDGRVGLIVAMGNLRAALAATEGDNRE